MSFFSVTAPAVVLGSAQPDITTGSVEAVRRRGGGGAVLVRPGDLLWVDVGIPRGDALWSDDISVAFHWLGEVWAAALHRCGISGAVWHAGPLVRTPWSSLVCFAGLGPGEVSVGGRKVIGMSQRRTRVGARFFCAVLFRWDPGALLEALGLPWASELAGVAAGVDVPAAVLEAAFLEELGA